MARGDISAVEDAVREHDASLAQVNIGQLSARALPALAIGAVVVLCATNQEASLALSAGVDEVLRCGEVTVASLRSAIERAEARASARSSPSFRKALLAEEDDLALGLLGAALSNQLAAPLQSASDEAERLSQSLPALLDASDDFVAWTSSAGRETPRRIAAARLVAPSSETLKEGIARLDDALHRARAIIQGMLGLSQGGELEVSASEVVPQVVDVLRSSITPLADLTVDTQGRCLCAASRKSVVITVTALIAQAVESIRSAGKRGTLTVRVYSAEEATIIEVQDDGAEVPPDLRPDVLEPYFRDPGVPRGGLAGMRDRARSLGGDLIVDTGAHGTTVRFILPAAADAFAEARRPAVAHDKRTVD